MKTLTFPVETVLRLLEHTLAAPEHTPLYKQPETACPGLWLVGDEGVYLMSNGTPRLPRDGDKQKEGDARSLVAYAIGCDPDKNTPDEVWDNKRDSFGDDDGSEFIDAADFQRPGQRMTSFKIKFNRSSFRVLTTWAKAQSLIPAAPLAA